MVIFRGNANGRGPGSLGCILWIVASFFTAHHESLSIYLVMGCPLFEKSIEPGAYSSRYLDVVFRSNDCLAVTVQLSRPYK